MGRVAACQLLCVVLYSWIYDYMTLMGGPAMMLASMVLMSYRGVLWDPHRYDQVGIDVNIPSNKPTLGLKHGCKMSLSLSRPMVPCISVPMTQLQSYQSLTAMFAWACQDARPTGRHITYRQQAKGTTAIGASRQQWGCYACWNPQRQCGQQTYFSPSLRGLIVSGRDAFQAAQGDEFAEPRKAL